METGSLFVIALLASLLLSDAAKCDESVRFDDYRVKVDRHQEASHPDLVSPKDRLYRTLLKDIYRRAPNVEFAGHYKVALIECAAGCRFGAAMDIRTGKIFWFPYETLEALPPDGWDSIVFCKNSTLIRFKGDFDGSYTNEERFYDFQNDQFKPVKLTALPMPIKDLKSNPEPEWALTGKHLVDPKFCDSGEAP